MQPQPAERMPHPLSVPGWTLRCPVKSSTGSPATLGGLEKNGDLGTEEAGDGDSGIRSNTAEDEPRMKLGCNAAGGRGEGSYGGWASGGSTQEDREGSRDKLKLWKVEGGGLFNILSTSSDHARGSSGGW